MNKNSKSVKHAKAVLKYWNKPFCTCLLNYIDELEKKAYKCEYYEEHADIFYNELIALREDSAIDKYIIEKIKDLQLKMSFADEFNEDYYTWKIEVLEELLGLGE